MTVMSTAISSAPSIVRDREFGFLREMLVAPVSRSALVTGKTPGGAKPSPVFAVVFLALAVGGSGSPNSGAGGTLVSGALGRGEVCKG